MDEHAQEQAAAPGVVHEAEAVAQLEIHHLRAHLVADQKQREEAGRAKV